jgi:hypothetical protein
MITFEEVRTEMEISRAEAEKQAKLLKDSYIVLDRLRRLYEEFGSDKRQLDNKVIADWVLSDNEGLRFDAQHLIREYKITETVPALKHLETRLANSSNPGSQRWQEVVKKLIMQLTH